MPAASHHGRLIATSQSRLIATINGCMFVFGLMLLLMGSLLPSLQLSNARAGSLGSFPLLGILAATVLIGPILDKVGAKASLGVALVLIIAALTAIPSLRDFSALAAAALVYGLGAGVLNAATNTLISTLSATGRGSALNLLGFSFSLGALLVPLLMSLTAGRFSPAAVLYSLAAVSALVLVLVLVQRFPPPAHASTPLGSLLRVLNQPVVWLFAGILFFESCSENCMFVWAGKIVQEALRLSVSRADIALLGLSAAMGVGRLAASRTLKSVGSRNTILAATGLIAAGAVLVLFSGGFTAMVAGFFVIGLGLAAVYPTVLGMAGDRFPSETGTVFGAIIAVSLVGGTAGPLIGSWAAAAGPKAVLAVPLAAAAAVAALTLRVTRRGPSGRATRAVKAA